jgi:hypothetical protein
LSIPLAGVLVPAKLTRLVSSSTSPSGTTAGTFFAVFNLNGGMIVKLAPCAGLGIAYDLLGGSI